MGSRQGPARSGGLYRKSLIIALCITCIPIALFGGGIYSVSVPRIEQALLEKHGTQMKLAVERVDDNLSHLEQLAVQYAFNPLFGDRLRTLDPYRDFQAVHDIKTMLSIIRNSSSMIDHVEVVLLSGFLISMERGVPALSDEKRKQLQRHLEVPRHISWHSSADEGLTLILKLPAGQESPSGALVITINRNKLDHMIGEMVAEEGGYASLFGSVVGLVAASRSDDEAAAFGNALDQVLIGKVGEQAFMFSKGEHTYSVSSGTFPRFGDEWTYVTASPVSAVLAPVVFVSRMVLFMGVFGILLAAALAWLASRELYRPIEKLFNMIRVHRSSGERNEIDQIVREWQYLHRESGQLRSRMDQALPVLREGFILQLARGHMSVYTEEELLARMEQLGWKLQGCRFAVLLVQMIGLGSQGRFLDGDEQLVTFAAANVAYELAEPWADRMQVINFQNMSVGLLINDGNEQQDEQMKSEAIRYASVILHTINSVLKLDAVIAVGKPLRKVSDIAQAFESYARALRFRDLSEVNQVIDVDELDPVTQPGRMIRYPFSIENEMLQALRIGMDKTVYYLLEEFLQEMSREGAQEFGVQQAILQLLGSIRRTILEAGYPLTAIRSGDNPFEQISALRDPREMFGVIRSRVIEPFIEQFIENQNRQLADMVESALRLIHAGYTAEMSLEICADALGTTPIRLSKGFKKVVGITFIDYLTHMRVEKAKELLLSTDMKISAIAESVGYQPSYFNRIFKKNTGVTASEYREQHPHIIP